MINRMPAASALAIACAWLAACSDHAPASASELRDISEADPGTEGEAAPAMSIPSGATLEQIIAIEAKKYAAGFVPDGALIQGSVVEGGRSDHLLVLRGGHCYRIVGTGGSGVEDMDLFLYDPEGVQTQQDPAQDRFPVLGLQAEICPVVGGAYRLQVHMYKGGGAFAARVYRTP